MKHQDEENRVPPENLGAPAASGKNSSERRSRASSGRLLALAMLLWKWTRHREAHPSEARAPRNSAPIEVPPPACTECAERAKRGAKPSVTLEVEELSHQQIGTFLVVCAFLVAVGGGVGFLFLYWTGGNNLLLGGCFALFLAGLGMGSVLWSHLLTLKKEIVEPREQMESPEDPRGEFAADFETGANQIHRRGLLKWMIAVGAGTFAAMVITMFRSLGQSPDNAIYSRVWKPGQRLMTTDGKPVTVDMLHPGSTAIVFPEESIGSEKAQTVLVKVEESLLQLPSDRSDWAPKGNLAFSRICTHAGCAVGMYETTTHQLMCPCHQSTFDVLRAACPTGGPAARPLPQLPLYADADGVLRAGGGFSDIPGPGFWGMP